MGTSLITSLKLQFAKQNGIIMFCLPPHTTHLSQPLDTCVFRPLKNTGMMVYMEKPSQSTTFLLRLTQENMCAGFHNICIYPFNQNKVQPTIMNNKQPSTKGNQKVCYMHILMIYF